MRIITCSYRVAKDGSRAENEDTHLTGKYGPNSKSRDTPAVNTVNK